MYLQSLILQNFRNFNKINCEFDKRISIILGKNGFGKSNIIEAINFISTAKSFKTNILSECILEGEQTAYILSKLVDHQNLVREINIEIFSKGKRIECDRNRLQKSSELLRIAYFVLINNSDIDIVSKTPSIKRQFLDYFLAKVSPEYLNISQNYRKLIKNKNILLKNSKKINEDILLMYNSKLLELNNKILHFRLNYIEYLNNKIKIYLNKYFLEYDSDKFEISYCNSLENKSSKEVYNKEMKYRECLYGSHRDSLDIIFKGRDVKKFMSLGEKRLISLLLKLGEKDYLVEECWKSPVILIDDAFLELDELKKAVFQQILENDLQIILTTVSKNSIYMPLNSYKLIELN